MQIFKKPKKYTRFEVSLYWWNWEKKWLFHLNSFNYNVPTCWKEYKIDFNQTKLFNSTWKKMISKMIKDYWEHFIVILQKSLGRRNVHEQRKYELICEIKAFIWSARCLKEIINQLYWHKCVTTLLTFYSK